MIRCDFCFGAPTYSDRETTEATYYCSQECLESDQIDHLDLCLKLRTRKSLLRAAKLLQKGWSTFRQSCFEFEIAAIESEKDSEGKGGGDKIVVRPGDLTGMTLGNVLVSFPMEDLLKDYHENVLDAILTLNTCGLALAYSFDLIKKLLEGIAAKISEEIVLIKDRSLTVCVNDVTDLYETTHHILVITIKRGSSDDELWVLDLTGTQFGFPEPLVSYSDYFDERIEEVIAVLNYETQTSRLVEQEYKDRKTTDNDILLASGLARMAYSNLTRSWVEEREGRISEILNGEDEIFESELKGLTEAIKEGMEDFKTHLKKE